MFTEALFWYNSQHMKVTQVPDNRQYDYEDVIHTQEFESQKKERNTAICGNVDRPRIVLCLVK